MEKEIKRLLNNYYGTVRSDDHKEEIVAFIETYRFELISILTQAVDEGD